jgi:hypothetical protein
MTSSFFISGLSLYVFTFKCYILKKNIIAHFLYFSCLNFMSVVQVMFYDECYNVHVIYM